MIESGVGLNDRLLRVLWLLLAVTLVVLFTSMASAQDGPPTPTAAPPTLSTPTASVEDDARPLDVTRKAAAESSLRGAAATGTADVHVEVISVMLAEGSIAGSAVLKVWKFFPEKNQWIVQLYPGVGVGERIGCVEQVGREKRDFSTAYRLVAVAKITLNEKVFGADMLVDADEVEVVDVRSGERHKINNRVRDAGLVEVMKHPRREREATTIFPVMSKQSVLELAAPTLATGTGTVMSSGVADLPDGCEVQMALETAGHEVLETAVAVVAERRFSASFPKHVLPPGSFIVDARFDINEQAKRIRRAIREMFKDEEELRKHSDARDERVLRIGQR